MPKVSREQAAAEVSSRPSALETIASSSSAAIEAAPVQASAAEAQSAYASQLAAIDEFKNYGPVLKSSPKPIQLTESETEYAVGVVKHIFKEHIVFQYNVSNTIPDTVLEQVAVVMGPSEESGLTEDFIIPIPALTSASGAGTVYVSFTRDEPAEYATTSFTATLKFVSKEVDPSSGEPEEEGYDDEYQVEDVDLGAGDVSSKGGVSRSKLTLSSTSPPPTRPSPASGTSWQALRRSPRRLPCRRPSRCQKQSSRSSRCLAWSLWVAPSSQRLRLCTRST